jgi:2EXR family
MATDRFEPKWPDERNEGGMYVPEQDSRTPHPSFVPEEVLEIVSTTYRTTRKLNNARKRLKLFHKFPLEIRRMVWRQSLPGRRVVEVFYDDKTGACRTPCPIPAALHVNSEARNVALECYELVFATKRVQAMIYFDFKVDALFVGLGNFSPSRIDPARFLFPSLHPDDLERLEHLIVDDRINPFYRDNEAYTSNLDSDNGDDNDASDDTTSAIEHNNDNADVEADTASSGLTNYGLHRLKSLTVINDYGDFDLVIHDTANNKGEFHAWDILSNGTAVPWSTPESSDYARDFFFSELWKFAEQTKWAEDTELTTLRYGTRDRLQQDKTWARRVKFMDQVVAGYFSYCLYPRDGVIDRILELEHEDPDSYEALVECFDYNDPEYIYITQNHCVCPIGHRHRLQRDLSLMDFDLNAALKMVDASDDEGEGQVPGSFQEDLLIGSAQSSSDASLDAISFDLTTEEELSRFLSSNHHGPTSEHESAPLQPGSAMPMFKAAATPTIPLPTVPMLSDFSEVESLKSCTSINKVAPSAQDSRLKQPSPSTNVLTAIRRRAYLAYYVCITMGILPLLVLLVLALAYSVLKFLVELITICMLLVLGVWLLALRTKVQERHMK